VHIEGTRYGIQVERAGAAVPAGRAVAVLDGIEREAPASCARVPLDGGRHVLKIVLPPA
jgi:hypothetical protein